jgi:hypothetical protein
MLGSEAVLIARLVLLLDAFDLLLRDLLNRHYILRLFLKDKLVDLFLQLSPYVLLLLLVDFKICRKSP